MINVKDTFANNIFKILFREHVNLSIKMYCNIFKVKLQSRKKLSLKVAQARQKWLSAFNVS